jgi:hypothetical protein
VLTDPRARRGRRHALVGALAIAAVCSGARSYTTVAEFARELEAATLARLGVLAAAVLGLLCGSHSGTKRYASFCVESWDHSVVSRRQTSGCRPRTSPHRAHSG